MFSSFNLASLAAFINLLASYGDPTIIPEDYKTYMEKSVVLEQIEQVRTQPDFDRIYCLWENQFTRANRLAAVTVFEQEIFITQAQLKSKLKYRTSSNKQKAIA